MFFSSLFAILLFTSCASSHTPFLPSFFFTLPSCLFFLPQSLLFFLTATIGADFLTKDITVDDRVITLQIWDTAGQGIPPSPSPPSLPLSSLPLPHLLLSSLLCLHAHIPTRTNRTLYESWWIVLSRCGLLHVCVVLQFSLPPPLSLLSFFSCSPTLFSLPRVIFSLVALLVFFPCAIFFSRTHFCFVFRFFPCSLVFDVNIQKSFENLEIWRDEFISQVRMGEG